MPSANLAPDGRSQPGATDAAPADADEPPPAPPRVCGACSTPLEPGSLCPVCEHQPPDYLRHEPASAEVGAVQAAKFLCSGIKANGDRCGIQVKAPGGHCHHHDGTKLMEAEAIAEAVREMIPAWAVVGDTWWMRSGGVWTPRRESEALTMALALAAEARGIPTEDLSKGMRGRLSDRLTTALTLAVPASVVALRSDDPAAVVRIKGERARKVDGVLWQDAVVAWDAASKTAKRAAPPTGLMSARPPIPFEWGDGPAGKPTPMFDQTLRARADRG